MMGNVEVPVEISSDKEIAFGSISEKERHLRITEAYTVLLNCINQNPEKEHLIIKEFLMNHGIYDVRYFDIDKLNNFANFLRTSFKINPQKNFKDNIIEALNYNSNTTNDYTETTERKTYHQVYPQKKYKQLKKETNKKIDLVHDMELQKGLYDKKTLMRRQIDLINKPKFVINLLTEEFAEDNKDKGNSLPKITEKTNKFTNERLYGVKKSNIDYEVLKKKNKLTEYICLIKAKNNLEMENLNQNFFNLNK